MQTRNKTKKETFLDQSNSRSLGPPQKKQYFHLTYHFIYTYTVYIHQCDMRSGEAAEPHLSLWKNNLK